MVRQIAEVKGVKYTVMKGEYTLGDEHTMQYTDNVLLNCTLETHLVINQCHPHKFNF